MIPPIRSAVSQAVLAMMTRLSPKYPLAALLALLAVAPLRAAAPATAFKFQFGADKAAPGYTLVPPALTYSKATGYGFEPGSTVTAVTQESGDALHRGAITASQPFLFSVAVPEGNYRVTVTLGDPKADAITTVKSETRRLMLERIRTAAGQFATRTFTVNVRSPKISTGGEVNLDSREMNLTTHEPISRDWDDKLTLAFSDSHPALAALEIREGGRCHHVVRAGGFHRHRSARLAGQQLGADVRRAGSSRRSPWPITPSRARRSRASSRSAVGTRCWTPSRPGDYVLIEFGCNDSKQRGPQNIYPGQNFSETYVAGRHRLTRSCSSGSRRM